MFRESQINVKCDKKMEKIQRVALSSLKGAIGSKIIAELQ